MRPRRTTRALRAERRRAPVQRGEVAADDARGRQRDDERGQPREQRPEVNGASSASFRRRRGEAPMRGSGDSGKRGAGYRRDATRAKGSRYAVSYGVERSDRARAVAAVRSAGRCAMRSSSSARMRCRFSSKNANTWSCVTARDVGIVLDAGVVVGDERDARVVHAELAREVRLRILRHVDDVPALRAVPGRLGAGREARALHDDDRAALVHRRRRRAAPASTAAAADDRAVRIGERHVVAEARVVERVGPAPRAVDELVEHDEVAGVHGRLAATRRARTDHRADAERAQRPEVGARGHRATACAGGRGRAAG